MIKTSPSIAAGSTNQMLTGSYTVKRVTVTGTAGGTVSFFDAVTDKTWAQPALAGNKTLKTGFARVNPPTGTQTDCGGITRIYDYVGVGYDTAVNIAANPTAPLNSATSFANGTNSIDTNIVTTHGLFVEAIGQAAVVTIEYYPNLSSA